MRILKLSLGLAACSFINPALDLSAQESTADARNQAKWNLSSQTAARGLVDSLTEFAKGDAETTALLVDGMSNAMLADVALHASFDTSKKQSIKDFESALEALVMDEVKQAVAFANLQSSIPVTEKDVLDKVGEAYWLEVKTKALSALKENHFEKLFQEARLRAVLKQRYLLESGLSYPDYKSLNAELSRLSAAAVAGGMSPEVSRDAFAELSDYIAGFSDVEADLLFEELAGIQTSLGDQKEAAVYAQYELQMDYIKQLSALEALPADLLDEAAIQKYLSESLQKWEMERQSDTVKISSVVLPAPEYPLFDASSAYLDYVIAGLETKRFEKFIESVDFKAPSVAGTLKILKKDIELHQSAEDSLALIEDQIILDKTSDLVSDYIASIGGASSPEQVQYITDRMTREGSFGSIAYAQLNASYAPTYEKARERLVQQQLKKSFPEVAASAPISPEMVEAYFIARPYDHIPTINDALRYMKKSGVVASDLLDETKAQVSEYFEAQTQTGKAILLGQIRTVLRVENTLGEALALRVRENEPYEVIYSDWEALYDQRWATSPEAKLIENVELYTLSADVLDWAARQHYESPIVSAPLSPPGMVPFAVFGWEREEYRQLKRERDRWERLYGEAYRKQQAAKAAAGK